MYNSVSLFLFRNQRSMNQWHMLFLMLHDVFFNSLMLSNIFCIFIYILTQTLFRSGDLIHTFDSRGEGYSLPQYFSKFFELVVGHLSADGFQPFGHKALPQWLTDDIIRYQAQDSVQALLQLGHCGARLVPVSAHLPNSVNHQLWCLQPLKFHKFYFQSYPCKLGWFGQQTHHHDIKSDFTHRFQPFGNKLWL